MASLVRGVGALFNGGNQSAAQAASEQQIALQKQQQANQNQLAAIAATRAQQTAQDQASQTGAQVASLLRAPRGQRLLLSDKSGGLAETLGTSA